ncbi:Sec-independent protein translocase protein TatB [Streptomyces sp. NBC_00259]|uniref:Sec-independent protein translocase protein TatB n=1 Tax=Streptomyces sp. NBC_00259 TaxID=2903643 RepID=UPI002E284959|nr:Sec-independent protein translocase protein TatB [Streptomyces sp. NBC_00259]
MFFDIGPLEILTIFVIAIVVLGPDKLPKAISETSALLRKVRSFSDSAQNEIRQELGPEFSDLQPGDFHPRALAQQALSRAEDEADLREITQSPSLNGQADEGDSRPRPMAV